MRQGDWKLGTKDGGVRAAAVSVGRKRKSAQNDLLSRDAARRLILAALRRGLARLAPALAVAKDADAAVLRAAAARRQAARARRSRSCCSGGGFVDRGVVFRDVTGDKRDDAIVRVNSGGANGVVAVYVFSTANKKGGKLKVIFRSQKLMRASTRVRKGVVTYRTARYEPGDELCCPSHVTESTLGWDKATRRMKVVKRETFVPPPEAQAPAAPAPPEDPN